MGKKKIGRHKFRIKWWDGKVKPGSTVAVLGARGRGKSVVAHDLVARNKDGYYAGIGCSNVTDSWKMMETVMPKTLVYPRLDEAVIARLLAIQKQFNGDDDWALDGILLSIDDCSADRKGMDTNVFRDLFLTGRHSGVTCFIAAQYLKDLTPVLRQNMDWFLCARETNEGCRKILYQEIFGSVFDDYKVFCKAMNKLTSNYKFIVFNRRSISEKMEDCVYVFRARLPEAIGHFRVGHRDIWLLDRMNGKRKASQKGLNVIAQREAIKMAATAPRHSDEATTEMPVTIATAAGGKKRKVRSGKAKKGGQKKKEPFSSSPDQETSMPDVPSSSLDSVEDGADLLAIHNKKALPQLGVAKKPPKNRLRRIMADMKAAAGPKDLAIDIVTTIVERQGMTRASRASVAA